MTYSVFGWALNLAQPTHYNYSALHTAHMKCSTDSDQKNFLMSDWN